MKILFVEPAGKGGMIHYAFQLCRGLAEEGADVTLLTARDWELAALPRTFEVEAILELWDPKPPSDRPSRLQGVLRKARRVTRALRYYREWLRIAGYVRRTRPDVVLLGDIRFPFDLFPLLLLRRAAVRMVDLCHNVRPFSAGGRSRGLFDRSRRRLWFYRRIYRLFDDVFVHFHRNRAEFVETFSVAPRRVGVIVHGNEEIFRELAGPITARDLRTRFGLPAETPVVLFFGTLSRYKGTDVLLEAFPQIHRRTGAHLVLAGFPFHDFDVEEHRALAARLGIADAVHWSIGYVDSAEVAAWMSFADAIVFPYREIYQSGALHVAQTFGVPTVASSTGAMQDVLEHEKSGLLVPQNDPAALAAAVTRLLTDRELAERVGSRAAEDARSRFSWRAVAQTILARLELSR